MDWTDLVFIWLPCKNPISKLGHILRSWRLGLRRINFVGGTQFKPEHLPSPIPHSSWALIPFNAASPKSSLNLWHSQVFPPSLHSVVWNSLRVLLSLVKSYSPKEIVSKVMTSVNKVAQPCNSTAWKMISLVCVFCTNLFITGQDLWCIIWLSLGHGHLSMWRVVSCCMPCLQEPLNKWLMGHAHMALLLLLVCWFSF